MATTHGRDVPTRSASNTAPHSAATRPVDYVWAVTRIAIGWIFLWAFLDKVFGLGFATPAERSWTAGASPTAGFLKGTGENALGGVFSSLAGQGWVDWLFMLGLLGVGAALMLGIGMRIAAVAGGLMLLLMWAAQLPLTTNPFMDDHIVYAIVLVGLAMAGAGDTLGLGKWWSNTSLVRKYPVLR